MKILALETANEQCSVAIADHQHILYLQSNAEPRMQTQLILPMIAQGLAEVGLSWQDVDAIAFSRGPGAFSGVRINAAVTQALAWTHDLPVIPVSTLQALAQHAYREAGLSEVAAVIDARMNEVYFGQYTLDAHGVMQAQTAEQLLSYSAAQQQLTYPAVGSGASLLQPQNSTQLIYANAQDIAEIARCYLQQGQTVTAEQALPVYLRDNAWKKIGEQHQS